MFCLVISFVLSGCITWTIYNSNVVFDKNKIILVSEAKECKFLKTIAPRFKMWEKGSVDTTPLELNRLKVLAKNSDANAISNVKINGRFAPLGTADAFVCPELVIEKYRNLQDDKIFIKANVQIID